MSKMSRDHYEIRMQRVLDHIDQHIDDDLSLDALSGVAAFSKYHFHRQFTATFGLSVKRYVQLARMKRASQVLARDEDAQVTEVAMNVGYAAPEAFARAFRRRIGQLPSVFQASPDWQAWLSALQPLSDARTKLTRATYSPERVEVIAMPATPVAVMKHRGDPARVGETIRRFIAWRRSAGLNASAGATYNVFHSDSDTVSLDDFRVDLCTGTDREIAANDQGVEAGVIPGGRCAVLRVTGAANLEPAILYLYSSWLPASGEDMRDFPLYCRRVSFIPMVAEHEAVTELFLPLR
ncbi:MAG TPA: GyrI-like domain-containing protein [Mesorhizobium sp.]|uniref:AraC family transcriptional regulator n=1 Tax=Mesorhizobium sp. TaxID=1871066 RepID=UPI002DDCDE95|nr:GyrI-like domain-containing protein [Mesorhizobium sp.]HEV2504085.1 GyrI-like domain-containing protein [Mesorhizobium sp.]